jgi:hypothetical protein
MCTTPLSRGLPEVPYHRSSYSQCWKINYFYVYDWGRAHSPEAKLYQRPRHGAVYQLPQEPKMKQNKTKQKYKPQHNHEKRGIRFYVQLLNGTEQTGRRTRRRPSPRTSCRCPPRPRPLLAATRKTKTMTRKVERASAAQATKKMMKRTTRTSRGRTFVGRAGRRERKNPTGGTAGRGSGVRTTRSRACGSALAWRRRTTFHNVREEHNTSREQGTRTCGGTAGT